MSIKKILLVVILVSISVYEAVQEEKGAGTNNLSPSNSAVASNNKSKRSAGSDSLRSAFTNRQSDVQIQGSGIVVKSLPDDLEGSRHQKFILKDNSGQTVLFAHNIDLAPKIEGLRKGDRVDYYGEYEWNDRGGVIHWTHGDPRGRHASGWLKHNGKTYQ
jgi:hypothetical protein